MDQLERLGNKLDLTNPAGPQLDVVGHALAPHFLLNQLLHGAQRFDSGEVQIAAVDERSQHIEQLRTGHLIAGHDARLDHGVTFPIAALVLVILFQRIEAEHQRAGRAVGPQAHVDTKNKAVSRGFINDGDQLLTEPVEKITVWHRAATLRFPAFIVGKNQIDIGG